MVIDLQCSAILPFLQRYPWAEHNFLVDVFSPTRLEIMLNNAGDSVQKREFSGIGLCYVLANEANQTAFGAWRYHFVRRFILNLKGTAAILTGFSPTPSADGEFFWDGTCWRVWADISNVAPEALSFIQHPPRGFGDGVRDIVLTHNPSRFPTLAAQINLKWPGSTKEVHLLHPDSGVHRLVSPSSSFGKAWTQYTQEELAAYFERRRKMADLRLNENKLAPLAAAFSLIDWMLLAEAGNNPFMDAWELAYVVTLRLVLPSNRDHRYLMDKLAVAKGEVKRLIDNNILAIISGSKSFNRLVPSWQGLLMYAMYLGVEKDDMLRFQPWPQKLNEKNDHLEYSKQWLKRLDDHQSLGRQFALALTFGARTIGNALGWPVIDPATTIASRLVYQYTDTWHDNKREWVTPDGLIYASIYRGSTEKGPAVELISRALFVEIDRATNPITRLDRRMDRYARVWPSLKNANPTLVWVIDGTENRERQILQKMRARGLDGWTVSIDRLRIAFDDPAWTLAPPVFGEVEYDAVGGLSPYRAIWQHTSLLEGAANCQFLFFAPWNAHNKIENIPSNIYRKPN